MNQQQFEFKVWDIPNKMFLNEFQTDAGQWLWGRRKDLVGQSTFKWILDHPADFLVLQWSGWKDENGVKIFPGDVVQLINEAGQTIKVICEFGFVTRKLCAIWDSEVKNDCEISGFHFLSKNNLPLFPIVNNYAGKHDTELYEVIGNVYETSL